MGKRKRRKGGLKVDEEAVHVKLGDYFTEFGVAEVDRLFYGRQFRKANSNCRLPEEDWIHKFRNLSLHPCTKPTSQNVDRIHEGHKFRKFSLHPCTKPTSQNDKSSKVDRISGMPDDILQYIISFSTIREGAATSILSTRWRYLWTTSFSTLNFDIPNMLGYDYPNTMFEEKGETYFMNRISNFTRWVNQVLELRRASRLDALRVSFVLNKDSASHIDKWIKFATAQGVTDIQLDFNFLKFYVPHSSLDLYEFPVQRVASSLKYLHLNKCNFDLSPDFTGFTSLITLYLSDIYVNQPIVDNILSKCPLLEFLSLPSCVYSNDTSLKFAGQSLRLKHLHIGAASGRIAIELHDVILMSFELEGCVSKLLIKSAPHLARLALWTHKPIDVLSNVPRLEMLFLIQPYEKSIMPQSVFSNLKRLVFIVRFDTTNLLGVVYILEACHLLQELELDMGVTQRTTKFVPETLKKLTTIPGSLPNNLKEIEIYGFEAHPERIELAKYLLKNAIVLEKMKLYTTCRRYRANGRWSLYEGTANQAMSIKEVCKMLQEVSRPSTKVELFSSLKLIPRKTQRGAIIGHLRAPQRLTYARHYFG